MRQLLIFLLHLPLITFSWQPGTDTAPKTGRGIQWTEGLSWEEVKTKAKQENKYIFLDIYATWCGPCKLMDKEVYPNDTLGDYFNQRFIAVKVQTDQTAADGEQVKNWYKDAEVISKQYQLEAYPSFIFLNPQGAIVEKQSGYKPVKEMITLAQSATQPGKVYNDPYATFESLAADYKKGIKKMDLMPYLIQTAFQLGENELFKQAIKEYTNYCLTLKPNQRYTKDNLQMWAGFGYLSSKTRAFHFFLEDGDIIDRVMDQKGFAQIVVCRTIENEIVWPFLQAASNNDPQMAPGMLIGGDGVKVNYDEANWKELYDTICNKYGKDNAKRAVLNAKEQWYMRNHNSSALAKQQLINLKAYPPDITVPGNRAVYNSAAWNIFLCSTNKKEMREALAWTRKVIEKYPNWSDALDTYANLQYKLGHKEEAINWQLKAIAAAKTQSQKETLMQVLEQMKRNEPTYVNRGAIWK